MLIQKPYPKKEGDSDGLIISIEFFIKSWEEIKMNFKKFLSFILAISLSFGVCTVAFAENQTGVPEGYIGIYTAEDLYNIRNNLSGKYILMNDIDLSVYENWEPIGTETSAFKGEIDGNDFSICNLSLKHNIESAEKSNFGLFGFINTATISKIKINNITVDINYPYNSTYFVGGVVAYCINSKINLCEVNGNISILSGGNIFSGGIVGCVGDETNVTTIEKCLTKIDMQITGENNSIWKPESLQYTYVGGVVGYALHAKKIYKCSNSSNISVNSINIGMAGSIAGKAEDIEIYKCKNNGSISVLGTCTINESPINHSVWSKIILFFSTIWDYFSTLFK